MRLTSNALYRSSQVKELKKGLGTTKRNPTPSPSAKRKPQETKAADDDQDVDDHLMNGVSGPPPPDLSFLELPEDDNDNQADLPGWEEYDEEAEEPVTQTVENVYRRRSHTLYSEDDQSKGREEIERSSSLEIFQDEDRRHGVYSSAEDVIAANVERLEFMKDNILFASEARQGSDSLKINEKHALEEGLFLREGRLSTTVEPLSPRTRDTRISLESDDGLCDDSDMYVIGDESALLKQHVHPSKRMQILVLGAHGAGKTSLVRCWTAKPNQSQDHDTPSPIGMSFATKAVCIQGQKGQTSDAYQVQLWDVSTGLQAEDIYESVLVDTYIHSARGIVLVYDACDRTTLLPSIEKDLLRIRRIAHPRASIALVLNKIDLLRRTSDTEITSRSLAGVIPDLKAIKDLAKGLNFTISATSIQSGQNVFPIFNDLVISVQKSRQRKQERTGLSRFRPKFMKFPSKMRWRKQRTGSADNV